jgi:hypothetical protein
MPSHCPFLSSDKLFLYEIFEVEPPMSKKITVVQTEMPFSSLVGKYRCHGGIENFTFRIDTYVRRRVCFVTTEFHSFCIDFIGLPLDTLFCSSFITENYSAWLCLYPEEKGREVFLASYCIIPDCEVNNVTHPFCLSFPVYSFC